MKKQILNKISPCRSTVTLTVRTDLHTSVGYQIFGQRINRVGKSLQEKIDFELKIV